MTDPVAAAVDQLKALYESDSWEQPSIRDDMAWVGRIAHITLDTDDKEALQKFHIWKKRINTLLYAHPWLIHPDPFQIAQLDADCKKCYAHYDQLLYAV